MKKIIILIISVLLTSLAYAGMDSDVYTVNGSGGSTNWDTAYGWGNHASSGYLTAETDPQVGAVTNNKWCIGDGSAIQCSEDEPAGLSSADIDTSSELAAILTDESGTDKVAFTTSPVFTTPNIGSATGSISGNAGTVTNGVYTTDNLSVMASTTSAQLAGVLSDESGTDKVAFTTSPVFTTPNIGVATATGNISGLPHRIHISIVNPNAVVTASTIIPIWTLTDAAITITKIVVTTSSASYEVAGDLKYANARIGLASAAVIDAFDTSSGILSDDDIANGSVASGKFVYLSFDSVPDENMTDCVIDVTYDYD